MWVLALVVVFRLLSFSDSQNKFPKLCNVGNYDDFLAQTNKIYTDQKEKKFRETIFVAKKSIVDLQQKLCSTRACSFKMNLNALSDMTRSEISRMTGSSINSHGE